MKKSFWESPNFWSQVATLVLSIFAIGGAKIDAVATGGSLIDAIWSNSIWAIGSIVVINIINPIWHWARTKRTERWAFLHSLNWWTNFGSLVVGIGVMYGIYTQEVYDVIPQVVQAVAEKNYQSLIWVALSNFVIPLVKIFFKKPILRTGGSF